MDTEQSEALRQEALKEAEKKSIKLLEKYGLATTGDAPDQASVALLTQSQDETENFVFNGQNAFGSMPFFERRQEVLARVNESLDFFNGVIDLDSLPLWKKRMYVKGMIAYELKFGKPLSDLVKEILTNYPTHNVARGKKISVCGLSGSGKSTSLEALREILGDDGVIIDSDTARYNLFAKDVKDAEEQRGISRGEIQQRIHNSVISGSMYLSLEYVTQVLRDRGYDVVISGTSPAEGADKTIYIEHRLLNPRTIGASGEKEKDDLEIANAAHALFEITQTRVSSNDSYDWDNANQITNFNEMTDVSVRVPEFVHGMFIRNLRRDLDTRSDIISITNPESADPQIRKTHLKEQISNVLADV